MFKVTTINLSADGRSLLPGAGSHELGPCDAPALAALLENLRLTDQLAGQDAEPEVVIMTGVGRFVVRTGHQKLFLYNARAAHEPYAELSAAGIVQTLSAAATAPQPGEIITPSPAKTTNRLVALAILCAGLSLNGYTLYAVFYTDSVNQQPPVTLLTDSAEVQRLTNSFIGTFQTGDNPGDRAIVLAADGSIRFVEFTNGERRYETKDTYRLGRHAGNLCFTTDVNGLVEVSNRDALVYYRDIYRRVK